MVEEKLDTYEFELPHKGVMLVLKKFNQIELDEFALEYGARGTTWNFLQDQAEKVKIEAETLGDFTGYGKRLESLLREQNKFALEMFYSFKEILKKQIVKTESQNGALDARTEEGWNKIFDRRRNEDNQFLMNLAEGFISSHKPAEEIVKNSDRALESS